MSHRPLFCADETPEPRQVHRMPRGPNLVRYAGSGGTRET